MPPEWALLDASARHQMHVGDDVRSESHRRGAPHTLTRVPGQDPAGGPRCSETQRSARPPAAPCTESSQLPAAGYATGKASLDDSSNSQGGVARPRCGGEGPAQASGSCEPRFGNRVGFIRFSFLAVLWTRPLCRSQIGNFLGCH